MWERLRGIMLNNRVLRFWTYACRLLTYMPCSRMLLVCTLTSPEGCHGGKGRGRAVTFSSPDISRSLSWLAKTAKLRILLLHRLSLWPLMRCLGSFLCVEKPTEMADEWEQGACMLLWQQWSYQRCWQHCQTEAHREYAAWGRASAFGWSPMSVLAPRLMPVLLTTPCGPGPYSLQTLVYKVRTGVLLCLLLHGRQKNVKCTQMLWELSLHKCVK